MKLKLLLGGLALAAAIAGPAPAQDSIKLGFITKFPVPFFATMEDAAKAYAAANPGVEIIYGQGTSATDIEGHPELIVEGETGLLVPPRNPDALAQAILRVLENPTRAKAMARAGRKRVEALFSMAQKVQRTEALYQRLLAGRRAS